MKNPEIKTGFVSQLDIDRLSSLSGGKETPLGAAAYDLLNQSTNIKDLYPSFKKDSDRWQKLVDQTVVIDPQVVNWWYGLVDNLRAASQEDDPQKKVIEFGPYQVKSKRLFSQKFGFLTDFAVKNVREKRPEAFDPRETATVVWVDRILGERPGRQVVYGMSCLNLDETLFIVTLTRSSEEPNLVNGKSYRVGELTAEEAEDLLSSLAQNGENREVETQEVVDKKGQKQTIFLLIVKGDENFVDSIEEIETVIKEIREGKLQIKLETVLENMEEPLPVSPSGSTLRKDHGREEIGLDQIVETKIGQQTLVQDRAVAKTAEGKTDHQEVLPKPDSLLTEKEIDRAEVKLQAQDDGAVSRIEAKQVEVKSEVSIVTEERHILKPLLEEAVTDQRVLVRGIDEKNKIDRAIKLSPRPRLPVIRSSIEEPPIINVVQNKAAIKTLEPATDQLNTLEEDRFISVQEQRLEPITMTLKAERFKPQSQTEDISLRINQQQIPPKSDSLVTEREEFFIPSVIEGSEFFLPATEEVTASQKELVKSIDERSKAVDPRRTAKGIGKAGLASSLEVSPTAKSRNPHLREIDEPLKIHPLLKPLAENNDRFFVEKTIGVEEQEEIQFELHNLVAVELSPKIKLETQVTGSTERRVTNIDLPESFAIEPEKDELAKAREVIKRLETVKRLKERPAEFSLPKAKRILADLSLPEVMKELRTVPLTKTQVVNRFEQREDRLSQAIFLHSLSRFYVSNQKTGSDSIPQSQVIFDRRWLPKVVYEAKDSLPLIAFKDEIIVPLEKRKIIRADEYQAVLTIDELLELELKETFLFVQPELDYPYFKFLYPSV